MSTDLAAQRPREISAAQQADVIRELRSLRGRLVDLKHFLETNESGSTDDPALILGERVDAMLQECDGALRWADGTVGDWPRRRDV